MQKGATALASQVQAYFGALRERGENWDGGYETEPDEERASVPDEPQAELARSARGENWICGRCELEWPARTARLYTPLYEEAAVCPHCAEVLRAAAVHDALGPACGGVPWHK